MRSLVDMRGRRVTGALAACVSVVLTLALAEGSVAARPSAFTMFSIPTAKSLPDAITAGPDGNLWFTEDAVGEIGRITPRGKISEFPIPTAKSDPEGIASGPDGNIWFTENAANQIGRITPSGKITEFTIPVGGSGPRGITAGPDHNIWFTQLTSSKIGRITPRGAISDFTIPEEEGRPLGITAGPDHNLWFTEGFPNKVTRVQPKLLPAVTQCVVPKLRGKTLAQARKLLQQAHCKLGKVTSPATHKPKPVVVGQKPAAKKALPSGTKVSLRLG